jgi:hypothetical protein
MQEVRPTTQDIYILTIKKYEGHWGPGNQTEGF